jgi:polyisoprenoid-binding protein YceI
MSWQFDPYHLQVEFAVKHFGMMTVRGNFTEVTAGGQIDPDNVPASSIEVTINASSLRTNNPQRDDGCVHPASWKPTISTIIFKATKIEPIGDGQYLIGDLTIKGDTRSGSLHRYGEINDDAWVPHRVQR